MNNARVESNAGRRLLLGALAGIVALVTPMAGVEEAGAATTVAAQVVRVVETGDWDPPSGDPSGVVRVGERLVVVDSEVDERDDACYEGDVNLWEVSLADPTNVENTARLPTDEPSGVSYDPVNRLLFVSDDENVGEGNKIWVVDYDDPSNVRGEIELGELEGAVDVEDPAYDPDTRELFSVGLVRRPGGDIEAVIFRITSTSETFSGGYTIHTSSIDHLHPTDDFEGLAIDPNTKNLLVGTQQGRQIYEVDRHDIGAEPLRVIDASGTGLQYISGLAAVDVGGTTHYWVTDRRSDCSALDGLLMELSAGPVSNRPPTLAAIPDQTVVSGETLTFTAVASDLDPGQSLTFSLVGAPAGATIGPTSGVFSWVASGNPREFEFKVRVTDNGSPQLSAERTVRVTVVAPNQPPVLLPIPDQTVVLGETLSFTAVASDPDLGQSLTFSLVGAPAGATIGRTSGVFSWVASGSPRELEFEVRVTDSGSPQLSAERTVHVTVESQPEEPPEDPEDPGEPPGEPGGPDTPPPGGGGGGGSNPPGGGDGGSKPPAHPDEPGGGGGSNQPPANPQDPGSKPTEPSDSFAFSDDNGHVFEADIEWLASKGITRGCNPPINDRFCPDDFVTRGQMAAFLVRALGYTDDGGGNEFVDDDGTVFEGDIDRLATAGVTRGCNPPTNDRFCPDDFVTRGQMAAFLVRALDLTGSDAGDRFGDDNGHVFESDIELLAAAGVTRGCNPPTNDRFCPDGYVTRGQMAAFLHRALGE